jgi:CheY-like chemotaxis protein
MKALVADDDLTCRTILNSVMRRGGHEVVEAADGEQALAALLEPEGPRLAVLDWVMPGLDGVEVCRRVRAQPGDRRPYLILVTTKGDKSDVAAGLSAGADDYVTKPFSTVELAARIDVGCRLLSLQDRLVQKVRELQEALGQIKTLQGILPICAGCKKIRDDQGYWNQVEAYISRHSDARFSHGLCPECLVRLYPEYYPKLGSSPGTAGPGTGSVS